jgi:transposase-like protein
METLTHRPYPLEYKQEAVRLVVSSGHKTAARRWASSSRHWIGEADKASQLCGVKSEQVSAEQIENNRLRAELARVTMSLRLWKSLSRGSRSPEGPISFIRNHIQPKRICPFYPAQPAILVLAIK